MTFFDYVPFDGLTLKKREVSFYYLKKFSPGKFSFVKKVTLFGGGFGDTEHF